MMVAFIKVSVFDPFVEYSMQLFGRDVSTRFNWICMNSGTLFTSLRGGDDDDGVWISNLVAVVECRSNGGFSTVAIFSAFSE